MSEEKKECVCECVGKRERGGQISFLSSLLVVPFMYHFVHRYDNAPQAVGYSTKIFN